MYECSPERLEISQIFIGQKGKSMIGIVHIRTKKGDMKIESLCFVEEHASHGSIREKIRVDLFPPY